MHRWVMHGRRGTNPFSAEHLDHHARPFRTFEVMVDWSLARPITEGMAVGGVAAAVARGGRPGPVAIGTGVGFTASHLAYTHVHHLIHHRAPRTALGRRLRKHHLTHHFSTPRRNHGVTHTWWDHLLGSHTAVDVVTVPRRIAPSWLVGADGEVRPEFAADYRVVGSVRPDITDADMVRSLGDLAPTAG